MDRTLSFANGVRIGEAWLRDSAKGDSAKSETPAEAAVQTKEAAVAETDTQQTAAVALRDATSIEEQHESERTLDAALEKRESPVTLSSQRAAFAVAAVPAAADGNQLARMRGITVGELNGPPTGMSEDTWTQPATGQVRAIIVSLLALTPPIAASLLLGLSHRASLIPFAPVWAWMAAAIALTATTRSAMATRDGGSTAWIGPVAIGVLLLVPSLVVLYLRLTLATVSARIALAQVVLYVLCTVALLVGTRVRRPV